MRDTCSTLTFRSRTSGWANGVDETLAAYLGQELVLQHPDFGLVQAGSLDCPPSDTS